jgi:hypothetical protein
LFIPGDPKTERQNGTEWQNDGMVEWWNGGKSPQILKDGMAENRPKS